MQGAWEVASHWRRELPGGGAALQAEGARSTAVIAALSFWDYSAVIILPSLPPIPPFSKKIPRPALGTPCDPQILVCS